MATLSLKISIPENNSMKTMQFDPSMLVQAACKHIRDKLAETNIGQQAADYGLFLTDEDPKKGVWLEPGRSLEYYLLRNGDVLEYKRKMRTLKVRMLDGTVKTVLVDDSQPVANLMVVICTKIGITNHDEYSLVREFPDESKDGSFSTGTLTLRRDKKDKDKTLDSKMEQLKKKVKTDDDLNWVDHSKTLREQGIDEDETLLLRRKFFFSDHNIDSRDPIQLNLLYVQSRDAIIAGTHPVTIDEASKFAGLQCQIQFGDNVENKHKPGFLDLKEFLPKDYIKTKNIEKKIFTEHKMHAGLNELEAKVQYVRLARSLKTYGVTFFLVKEKVKGKNKLVPRLLGVTKDSVLRLDERTKEILKTWPLTTVKRWAASPNSFTLDFGDYSDSYYSVQTTEGEQISQLIAGYIDIILKRKKAKDHFGIEGDEGSTMVEDSVSPYKATIMQHQTAQKPSLPSVGNIAIPAVMRAGTEGRQPIVTSQMPGSQLTAVKGHAHLGHAPGITAQHPQVHETKLTDPQRALLSYIDSGLDAVHRAEKELEVKRKAPDVGSDVQWKRLEVDRKKMDISDQLSAMNAATAQIINLTAVPEEEVDHPALGSAVTTITDQLPQMTKDVTTIASLMEDDDKGERLIAAAKNLCAAFSDLLKAAEPQTKVPRQGLLNAASRVGEATQSLLYTIGEEDEYDKETSDILLSIAKGVANAAAALVLKAKDVASRCEDQQTQNKVINSASQCALATSQLVACAKVVAPTIHDPTCQRQLTEASNEVAKAVENIVYVCQDSVSDDRLIAELKAAAAAVTHALNDLLNHVQTVDDHRARRMIERNGYEPQEEVYTTKTEVREQFTTKYEKPIESTLLTSDYSYETKMEPEAPVEAILDATDRLVSSTTDSKEMVRQTKILAKATAQLINEIKGQAEAQPDSDMQKRLLAAAKVLADATARLVKAAKGCATNPNDSELQFQLKKAAEDLRNAANTATNDALKKKVANHFQMSAILHAKSIARVAQEMVTKSTTETEQLGPLAANLLHHYGNLATYSKGVIAATSNPEIANKIRENVHELGNACVDLTNAAKSCRPGDPNNERILSHQAKIVSEKVSFILSALQASSRGTQACVNAASTISGILGDLDTTIMFASAGTLTAENESETFADYRKNILKTAKALVEDTKTLVAGAASTQEQLAVAVHNAVTTITQLAEVVKLGAASLGSNNSEAQVLLLNAVKDVATALGDLIQATKSAAGKNVNDPSILNLKDSAKVMVNNVTSLLKTVKTVEDEHQRGTRALESTIEAIAQEIRAFDSPDVPNKKSSPEDLIRITKPVTLATAKAVAAGTSGKQDDIIVAANMSRKAIFDLLVTCKQAAHTAETMDLKMRIMESGKSCAIHYSELLQMVHRSIQRPTGALPHEKQELINKSRTIATSITEIVGSARKLKGSDWVDPDDPTVIAETELLGAASSIEAAARKLASLQPRRTSIKHPDEDMNFDEMILDAAKSITIATAALVKAACAAQRELVSTGRVASRPLSQSDDGQWSEGLISAARHVATATDSLVEAANLLVQGQASEEKLISAAKQVASSTAQLLVACKVKADPDSQSMRRLQAAGNAVKKATDNLVRAAQQAIEHDEEQSLVISKRRVPGIAQEIIAREEILKKERELEEARDKLVQIRRAKYTHRKQEEYYEYHSYSNNSTH
ncbi:talin-1-like protein [Dinothrombium tinctorium]|uniref:Talin-1-like protein n=1 Tax=Dinothrombium tinctorium TaxID=1965070 RepID=A0A3S3P5T0_9ACAR|nr:talin-1-like protein [Dinothrombium tinctorium]